MVDMGQADRTLRQNPPSADDGVFARHKERMRWLEIADMFPTDEELKKELDLCQPLQK